MHRAATEGGDGGDGRAHPLSRVDRCYSRFDAAGGIEEFEALVRLAHAEALRASGDHDAARVAIRTAAERVEARAAWIASSRWQRTFRERVPENAQTLERAREWLEDDPPTMRADD